jgi:bifunctional non-homologous end joining protein LigD
MSAHFLAPMLAVPSAPFDSDAYSFEVKWDGIRALALVEKHGWQLRGRQQADYTARYPELEVLRQVPVGTLLDGELVVFDAEGRPDLHRLLGRHGLTDAWKLAQAGRWCPVVYLVFDLLYLQGHCLIGEPLSQRRQALAEMCDQAAVPGIVFSKGVIGAGQELYTEALAAGQEGVMAKHLSASYRPGQRSSAWRKIKPQRPGRTGRDGGNSGHTRGPRRVRF